MPAPGPYSCEYAADGGPGRFWDHYRNWDRFDQYQTVLFESPLAQIAAAAVLSPGDPLDHTSFPVVIGG